MCGGSYVRRQAHLAESRIDSSELPVLAVGQFLKTGYNGYGAVFVDQPGQISHIEWHIVKTVAERQDGPARSEK